MSIFSRKYNLDEKKYKQILEEEEADEAEFNSGYDEYAKNDKGKFDTYEDYIDESNKDSNYSEVINSYRENKDSYDDVNVHDYDVQYISDDTEEEEVQEQYEDYEDGTRYQFDSASIVTIISIIYKWFVIISLGLAVILVLYLLFKAKFVAIFLYVLSLACAFMFGYIVMFVVNLVFFKN